MTLFQTYRKLLPVFLGYDILKPHGFVPPNSIQKYFFRFTSLGGYFVFASGFIVTGGCLIFIASTLQEYTDNTIMFAAFLNDAIEMEIRKCSTID